MDSNAGKEYTILARLGLEAILDNSYHNLTPPSLSAPSLQLHQSQTTHLPAMNITNPLHLLRRLPPKFVPQNPINAHLRLRRPLPRQLHRHFKHLLGRRNNVHDPIMECFFARPAVCLKEHFPCDLRRQLEPWERADAVEVQPEVYWWLWNVS
jgi:hypothetical protein